MSDETAETTVLTSETPVAATVETPAVEAAAATSEAEGEVKTEGEAEKPVGAPEAYTDFAFADGLVADPELMGEFTPLATELNLSQEQAQKLVDIASKMMLKQATAGQDAYKATTAGWTEASKSDKEFGGAKFDASIVMAQRALNSFATPELKEALNSTGLGNHPEMIRLMVRIGSAMKEDGLVTGSTPTTTVVKSKAEILYGNPPKNSN